MVLAIDSAGDGAGWDDADCAIVGSRADASPAEPHLESPTRRLFISFADADMATASWLDGVLCAEYGDDQVYFYPRSNPGGENLVRAMFEIDSSSKVIAVLSEDYFKNSPAGLAEGLEALSRDWLGHERRLLWISVKQVRRQPYFSGRVGLQLGHVTDVDARADAVLQYVESAFTGVGYGGTPFVALGLRGESLPVSDVQVGPEAWGIDLEWRPFGPAPWPTLEEDRVRLDVLWPRDPSPFRAVLADWPGADLVGILNAGERTSRGATGRSWRSLPPASDAASSAAYPASGSGVAQPPGREGQTGYVTGLCIDDWEELESPVARGVAMLLAADSEMRSSPIVLRVEGGTGEEAIRVAAEIARRARTGLGTVEALTRLRPVSGARTVAGGTVTHALSSIGEAIRSRRDEQGVETRWGAGGVSGSSAGGDPTTAVGSDSVVAALSELSNGGVLPSGIEEAAFLRNVRDSARNLWRAFVRAYATQTDPVRWLAGLEVASEWMSDLDHWLDSATPEGLLTSPERCLWHAAHVVDRLLLGLRRTGRSDLIERWLPYASAGISSTLVGARSPGELSTEQVRLLAVRAPDLLPRSVTARVVMLAQDPEEDPLLLQEFGVSPQAALALALPESLQTDARLAFLRQLIRPHLMGAK